MYQFFVDESQIGKEYVTITGTDVNHIKNVLRMKPGEKIRVSTGDGKNLLCVIAELSDEFVQADIESLNMADTELPAKVILFQALPKGDRMETIIQKAVELGVTEIVPVAMKYCVVKLDAKRAENKIRRWQTVAESAAKQSKRSIIPEVKPIRSFKEAADYARECDVRLVPYENERGMAATKEALQTIESGMSVSIMIGPEGGFAEDEIESVRQDMKIISLGQRILRTDTAAITTAAMVMMELEMKGL